MPVEGPPDDEDTGGDRDTLAVTDIDESPTNEA
jgi:hypothetical protein